MGGSSSSKSSSTKTESYKTDNLNLQAGGGSSNTLVKDNTIDTGGAAINIETLDDDVINSSLGAAGEISAAALYYADQMGTRFADLAKGYNDAMLATTTNPNTVAASEQKKQFYTIAAIAGIGAGLVYLKKRKII